MSTLQQTVDLTLSNFKNKVAKAETFNQFDKVDQNLGMSTVKCHGEPGCIVGEFDLLLSKRGEIYPLCRPCHIVQRYLSISNNQAPDRIVFWYKEVTK